MNGKIDLKQVANSNFPAMPISLELRGNPEERDDPVMSPC